jgi:Uma2 family endonuclease
MPIRTAQGWKLTYDDYCKIPDDRDRHEILDGMHVRSPAPVPYHQSVSRRMQFLLMQHIEAIGLGEIYDAPIDVHLTEFDVVQPDLAVVLEGSRCVVGEKKLEGPPDLIVEILSPATRSRDLGAKRRLYERVGVREYWIVDPQAKTVTQLVRDIELFAERGLERERITLWVLPSVTVDLTKVW